MKKILILCTGNSCRSQMAEAFLKTFDEDLEVYSAGTKPSPRVHPLAIEVMKELNIDISKHYPKNVEKYLNSEFDFVITVCGSAKEKCPVFLGKVKENLHIGFDDPADAKGSKNEKLNEFRRIRDEIKRDFTKFFANKIRIKNTRNQKVIFEQEGLIGRNLFSEENLELVHLKIEPNKKMKSHTMPMKVIFYGLKGEIVININNEEFLLKENSYIEVNPKEERFAFNKSSMTSQLLVIKTK